MQAAEMWFCRSMMRRTPWTDEKGNEDIFNETNSEREREVVPPTRIRESTFYGHMRRGQLTS